MTAGPVGVFQDINTNFALAMLKAIKIRNIVASYPFDGSIHDWGGPSFSSQQREATQTVSDYRNGSIQEQTLEA